MENNNRLVRCPKCKHILTTINDGYHCGYCDGYYTVEANVMVEVWPNEFVENSRVLDIDKLE